MFDSSNLSSLSGAYSPLQWSPPSSSLIMSNLPPYRSGRSYRTVSRRITEETPLRTASGYVVDSASVATKGTIQSPFLTPTPFSTKEGEREEVYLDQFPVPNSCPGDGSPFPVLVGPSSDRSPDRRHQRSFPHDPPVDSDPERSVGSLDPSRVRFPFCGEGSTPSREVERGKEGCVKRNPYQKSPFLPILTPALSNGRPRGSGTGPS